VKGNRNRSKHGLSVVLSLLLVNVAIGSTAEAGLGKLWPFASKKHIKQQIDPLTGRVTEMEEVNRQHSAQIKELDERTQAGVRAAMSKTEEADVKAVAARQKALEAEGSATRAFASAGEVEARLNTRLENVENYRQVRMVEVRFKLNQTGIDENGRDALDQLAAELKDSKGYILELQGFADPSGTQRANLELSRQRAGSVMRYLAERHQIPLFRMRPLGMSSANPVRDEQGRISTKTSRRVEIHMLRNDATEVASK
jgi:OmpA-OmpF porin, OOP family